MPKELLNTKIMRVRKKIYKINRERAIEITMNHNGVSREIAENYTDSELREVLSHASGLTYTFKANF